jgi:hypothetical protein
MLKHPSSPLPRERKCYATGKIDRGQIKETAFFDFLSFTISPKEIEN